MRQKTDSLADKFYEQKFQIQGWNNDLEDLGGSNNLLKILQKKITFPVLQNNQITKKKTHKKIQTLPAVYESSKKITERKNEYENLSPKMHVQRVSKRKYLEEQQQKDDKSLKKSHTQKAKLSMINRLKQSAQTIEASGKKQKKKVSEYNKSYLQFFQSIKAHEKNHKKNQDDETDKKVNMNKKKQKKLDSVQTFAIKSKLAIFDEYNAKQMKEKQKFKSNQNENDKNEKKKQIKWQRFSLSQQKFINLDKINQISINNITKTGTQSKKNKVQKLESKHDYSKMFWMQKVIHKSKLNIKKIIKTQSNDFLDDHLQPYIQRQRQKLTNPHFNL